MPVFPASIKRFVSTFRPAQWIVVLSILLNTSSFAFAFMTVSGVITTSSVSVTGDVTMSSMTVSSLTITNNLFIAGSLTTSSGMPSTSVRQILFSSITVPTVVTSTSYAPVSVSTTIALTDASDYVRISLSGLLAINNSQNGIGYLTIKRDSTDLGNTTDNSGLAIASANFVANGNSAIWVPVGITIVDFPNDTSPHTYQPYIRTSSSTATASFTNNLSAFVSGGSGVGFLMLEEVHL